MKSIWGCDIKVIKDQNNFIEIQHPKINYSHQNLGGIHIEPHGLLFEKKDEKSLFEKIMWMYNNKDQMSLLSYNARYFAKMELDMNNRISQFINYYDSL